MVAVVYISPRIAPTRSCLYWQKNWIAQGNKSAKNPVITLDKATHHIFVCDLKLSNDKRFGTMIA